MAEDIDSARHERPLAPDELSRIHAYWRAANYLAVGQIYLMDNPLLREELRLQQ
jgi:xylulose-5-phosphate/fructose-6-phosphate phosphoketolase